ncbi:hypothetical protein BGZ49_010139 [Haplosporangium sp. Z 27]|nr:hypothetical protein BGZ49_010139 [Haplosporangium sp. Z 27]
MPDLENLREFLEEARIQTGIPGMSVAVLHKGELIFAEGFGKRNEHEPFTAETLTQIASVTKAFTAAAVGELVGEGKLDWDTTPVSHYLPEFQLKDPAFAAQVTLQDLLSHRTGYPQVDTAWFWNTESRKDFIKRIKHIESTPKMRAHALYNNVMYSVAGEAVANVAGISYEDLVQEKILNPLGLNNSGFSFQKMSKHPNFAKPYNAASFEDARNGIFEELPLIDMISQVSSAGDMYSNVLDLVRWGRVVMKHGELDGKQVLNRDSIKEILSGQSIIIKGGRAPEFAPIAGYGMGWILDAYKGNVMYHHNGHIDGYVSNFALFPDADLVIAHLTNIHTTIFPMFSVYHIADEILGLPKTQDWMNATIKAAQQNFEKIDKEIKGHLPKRIKDKPSARELKEFVGIYSNPLYGDISIGLTKDEQVKEELYFKLRVLEGKLDHYHYESFSGVVGYSGEFYNKLVTFTSDEGGSVTGLLCEFDGLAREFMKKD